MRSASAPKTREIFQSSADWKAADQGGPATTTNTSSLYTIYIYASSLSYSSFIKWESERALSSTLS